MHKSQFQLFILLLICHLTYAQSTELKTIPATVDFSQKIVDWDGFGFNYVETAQTRNYSEYAQDYGGFSLLSEKQKKEIIDYVFGNGGLEVQIVKMFLDPYHQENAGGRFDHERTTKNMRFFVSEGLKATHSRGEDLEIITTLYGPPAWATQQKHIGGRDLDQSQINNLGLYMVDWVRWLIERDYPIKYLSIHNEGEDFYRWDFENGGQRMERFDFNMYWPPEQVNQFLKALPPILEAEGVGNVKVTNGEPSNWTRFYHWGYANALVQDSQAMANLGLLTTHGFINGNMGKLSFSSANPLTTDLVRSSKPDIHAWTTSFSWGK